MALSPRGSSGMVSNREELVNYIADLVKEFWDRDQRAYQLTALGAVIASANSNYIRIMGMKLRPFLEFGMRDQLHFIEYKANPLVQGVVPIEVDLPPNTDDLFRRRTKQQKATFDRELWNAFAKPLFKGKRVVELHKSGNETISFDVTTFTSDEPIPDGALLIPAEHIVGPDLQPGPERTHKVYDNIETWLQANQLDPSVFRPMLEYQAGSRTPSQIGDIIRAFGVIAKEDQQRICIPLDIVIKWLSRM